MLYWPMQMIVSETNAPVLPSQSLPTDDGLAVGTYVAVAYTRTWYPGKILAVVGAGAEVEVTFMKRRGKCFVWPNREHRDTVNREFVQPCSVHVETSEKLLTVTKARRKRE